MGGITTSSGLATSAPHGSLPAITSSSQQKKRNLSMCNSAHPPTRRPSHPAPSRAPEGPRRPLHSVSPVRPAQSRRAQLAARFPAHADGGSARGSFSARIGLPPCRMGKRGRAHSPARSLRTSEGNRRHLLRMPGRRHRSIAMRQSSCGQRMSLSSMRTPSRRPPLRSSSKSGAKLLPSLSAMLLTRTSIGITRRAIMPTVRLLIRSTSSPVPPPSN